MEFDSVRSSLHRLYYYGCVFKNLFEFVVFEREERERERERLKFYKYIYIYNKMNNLFIKDIHVILHDNFICIDKNFEKK
jgi:hypothetical protein